VLRSVVVFLATCALLVWTRVAFADAVIVALDSSRGDAKDPIAARVADELEALGFQVIEATPSEGTTAAAILEANDHARAIVWVKPPDAEVWIVDAQTHAPVLRESIAGKKGVNVALRAVEVVRASLLQLPQKPQPKAPPKAVIRSPSPPPPAPSSPRSFDLGLAGGAAGFPASFALAARAGVRLAGRFDAELFGAWVPQRRSIDAVEGTARVSFTLIAARLTARFGTRDTALHLGIGGGLALASVRATARPPNEAADATLHSPAASASITLKQRVFGPLDVWGDVSTTLTRPMVVSFVGREVDRFVVTSLVVVGLGVAW
jgi:hypothetical protein